MPVGRRADPRGRSPATSSRSRTRWSRRSTACPEPAAYAALEDELGDLLYQVVFHAVLAQEAGEFTMADVARGIHDKLVRRHPHVFGDVVADETVDVMRNWEQIKKDEKGTTSIVAGITPGLPSLLYTHKLFRKAASLGLDPGSLDEALDRIDAAVARAARRSDGHDLEGDLAQMLAARSSSPAPAASTPSPRCAAGPRPIAAGSRRWSGSPPSATSTSPPPTAPASPHSGSRPPPTPSERTCVVRGVHMTLERHLLGKSHAA